MLINCPECNEQISDDAYKCPKCGKKIKEPHRGCLGLIFLWSFYIFNLFMAFASYMGCKSTAEMQMKLTDEASKAGGAIGTVMGMSMVIGIWAAGALILGIFVLLTRPKE